MAAIDSNIKLEPPVSSVTSESMQFERRLPVILSVVAGLVDVISFLNLGLFTAHITGNLVVISAALVRGSGSNLAQVMAVPVFAVEVGIVWLIAKKLGTRGSALARPLLLIQFLLLILVLALSVIFNPAINRHGFTAVIVAMIAVAAMACQCTLSRLAVPGAPSTGAMTGNLTTAVLALLDTISSQPPTVDERLKKSAMDVMGFCLGCIVGAAAVSFLGEWAWSIPVVLAGMTLMLR